MEAPPGLQRFTQGQRVIRAFLLLWLLWEFRNEFVVLIPGLWERFVNLQLFTGLFWATLADFFLWAGLLFVIYAIFIFWFAQFVLPVSSTYERLQAFWRLLLFSISFGRWHGPAVFVRNGEYEAAPEELEKNKPGVAFVDLRSAIVLDRHIEDNEDPEVPGDKTPRQVHFLPFGLGAVPAKSRVAGPGLCFIKGDEKIIDAVDLRKQNRSRGKIQADTLDGIRVETSVNAAFTLGQPPEVLDVCLGETREQVFVITWENDQPPGRKKIKTLSAELNPEDKREIINFIKSHPDVSQVKSDVPEARFPFTFDPKRVERAVYTLTHLNDPTQSPSQSKKWFDWPTDVAAEKFHVLLAQHPYLELYDFDNSHAYTIKKLKNEIFKEVRNLGVLAYRVVMLHNRQTLLKENQEYLEKSLLFYPPRQLTNSQVLRDRGIKVLSAGCGDLDPDNKGVLQNLKQTWLSKKEKEVALKEADNSLEIARIRNRARVRAQQSMLYHLAKILENRDYPQEALAILVFQELETAAANPATRKLLPEHTLDMLSNIREMLVPDQRASQDAKNYPQDIDEKNL